MMRRTAPAVRPGQVKFSHDAFVCGMRWGIDLEGVEPSPKVEGTNDDGHSPIQSRV